MTDVGEYIRSRENRGLIQVAVFVPFTLIAAVGVAIRLGGVTAVVLVALVVVLEIVVVVAWARPSKPAQPMQLARPYPVGAWPASAPVFDFADVLARNPRLQPTSALLGTLTLDGSGARWTPSAQTARAFGAAPVSWDADWTIRICGVRGFGGQMRLTLENPGAPTVVLWLRRASALEGYTERPVQG